MPYASISQPDRAQDYCETISLDAVPSLKLAEQDRLLIPLLTIPGLPSNPLQTTSHSSTECSRIPNLPHCSNLAASGLAFDQVRQRRFVYASDSHRLAGGCRTPADSHRDRRPRHLLPGNPVSCPHPLRRGGVVRAVAATDLPHDFTLEDLHWPMPAMVVGFSALFMQEYLGRDSGCGRRVRVDVPTSRPGGGSA